MPNTCVATIADVRGVIAASTACGSMVNVLGSMSAKTGVHPSHTSALVVATYENAVVTTSPSMPSALIASCSATVPLATNSGGRTSSRSPSAASSSWTSGPLLVSQHRS